MPTSELLPTTSNLSLAVDLPIEAIKKILEEQVPNPIKFDGTNDWHVYGDLPRQPISVHVDAKTKKINLTTSVAGGGGGAGGGAPAGGPPPGGGAGARPRGAAAGPPAGRRAARRAPNHPEKSRLQST